MQKGVLHYKPATGRWQKTNAQQLNLSVMKNGTLSIDGFASLQACEMEEINGGQAPKIPLGFTWKDIIMFGLNNVGDIAKGLYDGFTFPDKK